MSNYILAFRGQPDRTSRPDEGQQWGAWFTGLGAAISDMGNQVGTVRTLRSENGGNRLHPSTTATSIRRTADGGVAVSDGAFAETKEVIGGYYLIDAADLDEAMRIAVQVPTPFGGVEVRPIWTSS